jgi:tRNA nucleotidyltransferase (CCA-adding enzyme)
MVPALPVDPEIAKPIVYPVVMVGTFQTNSKDTLSKNGTIKLELDADEQHLFESILKACKALHDGKVDGFGPQKLQVRVAGGWVRDKILGLQTHDVDIALDACTGVEFANALKKYMQEFEEEKIGKIGVIAANPAQSKHLETATTKVFGIEVDFCNLRHETYAENSRIPTTMLGTPLEDSYRRDFTMNALYYNLHSNEIEDWTRKGLEDLLEIKLVTTPLDAYQTFHDDPLRVLRAIRFAVRYKMQLSEEVQAACVNPQIHEELHRKVSRERVGKELEGMLSGKHANPTQALKLICNLKLAGSIFCLPPDDVIQGEISKAYLEGVPYQGDSEAELGYLRETAWEEATECTRLLPAVLEIFETMKYDSKTSFDHRLTYLAVVLLPYAGLQFREKKKIKTVIEYMVREGIKFKNKDIMAIITIFQQLDSMKQLIQRPSGASPSTRLQAGLVLRGSRDMWVTVLVLATVASIRSAKSEQGTNWLERANHWYNIIVTDLKLDACWKVSPILNGKEMIDLLGLSKGPLVGEYAQEQTRWMLMNPEGTIEECIEFLKTCKKKRDSEQEQAAEHVSKKLHL